MRGYAERLVPPRLRRASAHRTGMPRASQPSTTLVKAVKVWVPLSQLAE